jgi:hypothetical protein
MNNIHPTFTPTANKMHYREEAAAVQHERVADELFGDEPFAPKGRR